MTSRRDRMMASMLALGLLLPAAARGQGTSAPDPAKLQAEIVRLDKELREQKQLLLQMMQADQQRYDMLLQLIRSLGGQPTGTPDRASGKIEAPPSASLAAVAGSAGAGAAASGTPAPTAMVSGKVQLPPGASEAWVYLEGRGPTRAKQAEIRQEGKQFTPPVTVLTVGSRVIFPNADNVFHNVFSRTPGAVFDLGTVKGGESSPPLTLVTPGHVEIFCNIHSKMRADLLVVPNTYYSKVRPDGSFAIAGVPVGSRKLVLWGPGLKPVTQSVEVRSTGTSVKLATEAAPPRPHLNKQGKAYTSYE